MNDDKTVNSSSTASTVAVASPVPGNTSASEVFISVQDDAAPSVRTAVPATLKGATVDDDAEAGEAVELGTTTDKDGNTANPDSADQQPAVPLGRAEFALVFTALLCAVFLPALDMTVVATVLQAVVSALGQQGLVSWVGAVYLFAGAVSSLVSGTLADAFGRKWVFAASIAVFMAGSAVSGAATSIVDLIVGRAISGLGGGSLLSCVLIIVADIVSLRDRGKFQGLIGAVFGLSSVAGPLVGGGLSDGGAWRWCFYMNLVIGSASLATVVAFLRFPVNSGGDGGDGVGWRTKLARLDYAGMGIAVVGITSFLTALQQGGTQWAWAAPQTITLLVLSAVLLAAFVAVQQRARAPVVPPSVFMNRSVVAFLAISFGNGATFLAAVYYVAIFFQVEYGQSATSAGVATIPLVAGNVFMSILSGQVASRTGRYAAFPFVSGAACTAGVAAMSFLGPDSTMAVRAVSLLVLGLGIGSTIQIRIIGLQASVDAPRIAVATAVAQFLQTLGGSFSIAVTGTVLNNELARGIPSYVALSSLLAEPSFSSVDPIDVVTLRAILTSNATLSAYPELAPQALRDLQNAYASGFSLAMRFLILFSGLVFVASFFVKDYGLRRRT